MQHPCSLLQVGADMISVKMAIAGALVFAPLNHALGLFLARLLAGRGKTGTRAKVEGILANNLLLPPAAADPAARLRRRPSTRPGRVDR